MRKSMIPSLGLATAFSALLLGATALAGETATGFHATSGLASGLTAMPEDQLAAIEGGNTVPAPFSPICVGSAPFQPGGGLISPINLIAVPVQANVSCNNIAAIVGLGVLGSGVGDSSVGQSLQSTDFQCLVASSNGDNAC